MSVLERKITTPLPVEQFEKPTTEAGAFMRDKLTVQTALVAELCGKGREDGSLDVRDITNEDWMRWSNEGYEERFGDLVDTRLDIRAWIKSGQLDQAKAIIAAELFKKAT